MVSVRSGSLSVVCNVWLSVCEGLTRIYTYVVQDSASFVLSFRGFLRNFCLSHAGCGTYHNAQYFWPSYTKYTLDVCIIKSKATLSWSIRNYATCNNTVRCAIFFALRVLNCRWKNQFCGRNGGDGSKAERKRRYAKFCDLRSLHKTWYRILDVITKP